MTHGKTIHDLAKIVHEANRKWWSDLETGEYQPEKRCPYTAQMLMVSEIAEMMEAVRKSLPSDHLEGFTGEEEEAADLLIRLLDYARGRRLRIGRAFEAKMIYNAKRADHSLEHRRAEGGKKV